MALITACESSKVALDRVRASIELGVDIEPNSIGKVDVYGAINAIDFALRNAKACKPRSPKGMASEIRRSTLIAELA